MKILKMKNLIIFISCLVISFSQAQDDDNYNGEWLVTNQFGTATIEADNAFKINASVFEGFLGREFFINKKSSLITGLEFLRVKGDFSDIEGGQLFLNNNHINIPIRYRFYGSAENPLVMYGDFGVYGSYLYKSEIENISENIEIDETGLGFNFGVEVHIGLKYRFEKYSFNIGFKYKSDFATSYKDSKQKIELNDFYTIQLGLAFNL